MTDLEFDNRQKYANQRVSEFKCKLSYAVTREFDNYDSLERDFMSGIDDIDSDTACKVLKIELNRLRQLLEEHGIKTRRP